MSLNKPKWIKKNINPIDKKYISFVRDIKDINTLCLSSNCPNFYDCFKKKKSNNTYNGK
ncbi:hypothetical protein ACWNYO_00715 [Candidatus Vidania fulgoroideorum]